MAGSYWDLIIAGISAYIANRGTNGGTPNQYPVELPPEMKRIFDEAWNVYKGGGSPAQRTVMGAGVQFLGGMPTTAPNFSFVSPLMRGQTFAGGVQIPKIDTSQLPLGGDGSPTPSSGPSSSSFDPAHPQPTAPNTGGYGGMTGGNMNRQNGPRNNDWPFNDGDPSIARHITENPTSTPGSMGPSYGSDPSHTYSNGPSMDAIKSAFDKWRNEHPNWATLGPNAAISAIGMMLGITNPVGAVAGIIGQGIRNYFLDRRPPPTPSGGNGAPMIPPNGSPGSAPPTP